MPGQSLLALCLIMTSCAQQCVVYVHEPRSERTLSEGAGRACAVVTPTLTGSLILHDAPQQRD